MKYCSTCGREHAQHEQYCTVDGTVLDQQVRPVRFEQATTFCVGCGEQLNKQASYCPNCGHSRLVAATSEGSIADRLPGMDDLRKKFKAPDWGKQGSWKQKGRQLLSGHDFSFANPNLLIGSITALMFLAALFVLLFVGLGLADGNSFFESLEEAQRKIGADYSTFGLLFFIAYLVLSGVELTSSDDLRAKLASEITGGDSMYFGEIQNAATHLDFHLSSGHGFLSLPGLLLLISSAWLLERGGVTGGKAASWNERVERALAFAVTLAVLTLLIGIAATDFGIFNLHLIKGMVQTFILSATGTLLFLWLFQKGSAGYGRVARIGALTMVSVYLAGLLISTLGQIVYINQMDETNQSRFAGVPISSPASVLLLSGASPFYALSQAGQVDMTMTVLMQQYKIGTALYGEDRLGDVQESIAGAMDASNLDVVGGVIESQIEEGRAPDLSPKIEQFDETLDIGVLVRMAQLANVDSFDKLKELTQTSVAPFGIVLLLVMFLFHGIISFRWIRTIQETAVYALAFAACSLLFAYFTQTALSVTWDQDIMIGISVSALTFFNIFLLFVFPFAGALAGYFFQSFKGTNR